MKKTVTLSWDYDENTSLVDMRGNDIGQGVDAVRAAMTDRPWRSGRPAAPDEPEVVLQFLGDMLARLGFDVVAGAGVDFKRGDA